MSTYTTSDFASRRLFLFEFYTFEQGQPGFDINFAWVFAPDMEIAEATLKAKQGERLDEIITSSEQSEISTLSGCYRVNTPDANLFIIEAVAAIKAARDARFDALDDKDDALRAAAAKLIPFGC